LSAGKKADYFINIWSKDHSRNIRVFCEFAFYSEEPIKRIEREFIALIV